MTYKDAYCIGRAEYLAQFEGYSLMEGYDVAENEWKTLLEDELGNLIGQSYDCELD